MFKWLKRILIGLGAVMVLLVALVVALPLVIDPNAFKPTIRDLAAEQGLALEMSGPISWQFYPDLGLALEDIAAATLDQPDQPLARLDKGVAAVQLMPLFQRQIRVRDIIVDGARVDLQVNANGEGNWEGIGTTGETPDVETTDDTEPASQGLDVSVQSIRVNDAELRYRDARSEQDFQLSGLNLRVDDVNLEQRPIPLYAEFELTSANPALTTEAEATSTITVDEALSQLALGTTDLRLRFPEHDKATIELGLSADMTLDPALQYQGNLAVEPVNVKALLTALGQTLPPMAQENALERVSISAQFAGTDREATLSNLSLVLDNTALSGNAGWRQGEQRPALSLQLQGDAINVDHYLPPSDDEQETPEETAAEDGGDTPLPLEPLRAFDLDFELAMDEMIAYQMPIASPTVKLTGDGGRWRLESLSAGFYDGTLNAAGELDAGGDAANIELAAQLENLALRPLLQTVAEFDDVSGSVDGQVVGTGRGATVNELLNQSDAEITFTSPGLTLAGFNAEQYYCQMAARVNDEETEDTEQQWPQQTDITNVQARLTYNDARLSIAALRADLGNLVIQSNGFVDLNSDDYRVRLPMLLAGDTTSDGGCRIDSEFLQSTEVDIVGCQGSLAEMNLAKQCGLDTEAVTTLARQAVRYNVQKRTDEKKQEVRQELKDTLRERLGIDDDGDGNAEQEDDEDDTARDLLRNLLNR